jgi:uncharacterized protein YecE (DUF72 family)
MCNAIKIGTCGFPLPKQKLATLFNVAEVQQTFYQPPMLRTLERWRHEVPTDFEYTIKAWQLITHPATSPTYRRLTARVDRTHIHDAGFFRDSEIVHSAWKTTLECANVLSATKILFQCPASFLPTELNIHNLRGFFETIDRTGFTLMWEPRGSWQADTIAKLCDDLELVHVVDPFKSVSATNGLCYYRLHGIGGYQYQYSNEELLQLQELINPDRQTYVMFNNSKLLEDGLRFKRLFEPDDAA